MASDDDHQRRESDEPQAAGGRAMRRFAERVVLTGVSVKQGNTLIFQGWDRRRMRAVRVIVEDAA